MRLIIIVCICIFFSYKAVGQIFKRLDLVKGEKSEKLIKYIYKDSHKKISLVLKKDGTYLYDKSECIDYGQSQGEWKRIGKKIFLTSFVQKDSVPISVSYTTVGSFVDSLRIAVVQNLKGEPLTDAFVIVNSDSIKCLPLVGKCNKPFERINRVKVLFENGFSSSWIHVDDGREKIVIRVLLEASLAHYLVMKDETFTIVKGGLMK